MNLKTVHVIVLLSSPPPPNKDVSTRKKVEDLIKKACEAHIVLVVGHPCFPIRCYMWHSVVAAVTLPACLAWNPCQKY